ncbi:MAG: DUF1326 domain-containing protein [SAR202 cluster bacterium]|nr:DUF1326 domain-containing protein [SAR202 cluster bacterium]
MFTEKKYSLKGHLVSGCNCDWGCPCNFEVAPSYGNCEGVYFWHVETGHYDGVSLDGANFGQFALFPEAVHLGNGTGFYVIDERLSPPQRAAVETILQEVPPFGVFHDLTSNFLGFSCVSVELNLDGITSGLKIPGVLDLQLGAMKNPVTGEDELATLSKPTGFTANVTELCSAERFTFEIAGRSYDHSGKYGEFCPFEYSSD